MRKRSLGNSSGKEGLPCGSAGQESASSAGDLASIPGLGRCPGGRKGYPLQDSGPENSKDCTAHQVTKRRTRLSYFHFRGKRQEAVAAGVRRQRGRELRICPLGRFLRAALLGTSHVRGATEMNRETGAKPVGGRGGRPGLLQPDQSTSCVPGRVHSTGSLETPHRPWRQSLPSESPCCRPGQGSECSSTCSLPLLV